MFKKFSWNKEVESETIVDVQWVWGEEQNILGRKVSEVGGGICVHGVKAAPCGVMRNRSVGNNEAAEGDWDQSLPGLPGSKHVSLS